MAGAFDNTNYEGLKRRARDPETGESVLVPADMSWKEWKASLQKNKDGLLQIYSVPTQGVPMSEQDALDKFAAFKDVIEQMDEPYKTLYSAIYAGATFEKNTKHNVSFAYDYTNDKVCYNPDAPDFSDSEFTETMAHRLDCQWANMLSDKQFQSALTAESNGVMMRVDWWNRRVDQGIIDNYPALDIISALSRGLVDTQVGHPSTYWNAETVSAEAFANFVTVHALRDEDAINELKTCFPDLYVAFTERIEAL